MVATPNTRDEQDEAYDPFQHRAETQFNHSYKTAQALHNLEESAVNETPTKDDDINDSPSKNIDDTEAREKDAGAINYTGSGSPGASAKKPISIREELRGRGPLGILIALLFAGGGALSVFFTPGLLIDTKEKLIEKFNDKLAVMDNQSLLLLKKKFKGQGTITGCTKLSIRCKFNTLSDRQLRKLEKGGEIKVNTTGDKTLIKGRHKIESFEFKGKTITAENLIQEVRGSPEFRLALRKGYNPKLAGFADAAFTRLAKRIGINKRQNLTATTPEALQEELVESANGTAGAEIDTKVSSVTEDCTDGEGCVDGKRTVYTDTSTSPPTIISKEEYDNRLGTNQAFKAELDARKTLSKTGGQIAKSTLKGVLTVSALGLGAVDNACTGYTMIRVVGFAAKYAGMLPLLRYFQVLGNTADADKAGAGIAEANTFLGDILTSTNSQGKSATDSYGYKYAVYGDIDGMPRGDDIKAESVDATNGVVLSATEKQRVIADSEVTKYINGQLVSDNLLTSIIGLTGKAGSTDEVDSACGFIKSGWGQTIVIGTAIAGAAVAFFTGGLSLGWGTAAQISVTVAITVAMAMLQPKLIDIASGTVISGLENGNEAGNALTSGAGAMNTQTFMSRGIPILQKEDAVAYENTTRQTLAMYAEEDRLEHSPLDPTNRNTFMGSVVSNLLPFTTKLSSLTTTIPTIASLTAQSLGNLLPQASAQDKLAQYNICQDRDYNEQNIAADPFCNFRGGFTEEVMNIDSDKMLDYMIANNYINEETGEPKSSDNEYGKYLQDCVERSVPIGGFSDNNPDRGVKCIQGRSGSEEPKYNMFRKMSVLMGVNDGMDNGEVAQNASSDTSVVSGEARALALQVADNPNIDFVNPGTEEGLKTFSSGGQMVNGCGQPMTVSRHLLGALLTNASKYKILINNIGFKQDRNFCEEGTYQHPKGTAVDINDITLLGGGSTGGSISLPGGDAAIVNQYATDFLAALPLNRGGVGQSDHGVHPTFPSGSVALNGTHSFPDADNHLHIDARNRENLNDTE